MRIDYQESTHTHTHTYLHVILFEDTSLEELNGAIESGLAPHRDHDPVWLLSPDHLLYKLRRDGKEEHLHRGRSRRRAVIEADERKGRGHESSRSDHESSISDS